MTEQEQRDEELAQEEYRSAWIKAAYETAGWEKKTEYDDEFSIPNPVVEKEAG